jgi:hypothetical protein
MNQSTTGIDIVRLPTGHTSRKWGNAVKDADGSVTIERDRWEGNRS